MEKVVSTCTQAVLVAC